MPRAKKQKAGDAPTTANQTVKTDIVDTITAKLSVNEDSEISYLNGKHRGVRVDKIIEYNEGVTRDDVYLISNFLKSYFIKFSN